MTSITIETAIKGLEELKNKIPEILEDIRTLVGDEIEKNFETESYFGRKWPKRRRPSKYVLNKRDDNYRLLYRTGGLMNSIRTSVKGEQIIVYSKLPYAKIHNEGGEIIHPGGTAYYYDKKQGKIVFVSNIKASVSKKEYKRTLQHRITIRKRQFIGAHPKLIKEIENYIEQELNKFE